MSITPLTAAGHHYLRRAAEIVCRIPRGHPRVLCTSRDLQQLTSSALPRRLGEPLEAVLAAARAALQSPVAPVDLPSNLLIPDGLTWDQRYPASIASFAAHERMMAPLRSAYRLIPACALAYRVTGEAPFREHVLTAMDHLAAIDLTASSYTNTHQFHGVVPALAIGLDLLWNQIPEPRRSGIVSALVARAQEFHRLTVQLTFDDPLNSHHISYGPPDMLHAALVLTHHEENATNWLADIIAYLEDVFPGLGGDDGGWAQGFGYIYSPNFQRMCNRLLTASGVDFSDRPWARNNRNQLLYFRPPWSSVPTFGDVGYAAMPGVFRHIMAVYSDFFRDPYAAWYAASVPGAPAYDPVDTLSHRLVRRPGPRPRPPKDLPPSIHLRDVGWVAFHDQLADPQRNVMFCFKSSPFGSFSHSHADQNSFVLEAYGRPLLIDSGYYPWYGSPHDLDWTRQTRAHNAVLFNGKGQGVWSLDAKGTITSYLHTPAVDYVAGDATPAYREPPQYHGSRDLELPPDIWASEEGVLRAVRHVLYIRPGLFFIIDDVHTQRPARIDLAFHATTPFALDRKQRQARVSNTPARVVLSFAGDGPLTYALSDRFTTEPQSAGNEDFPPQYHLTASYGQLLRARLLVTVLHVSHDQAPPPEPGLEAETEAGSVAVTAYGWRLQVDGSRGDSVAISARPVRSGAGRRGFAVTTPRGGQA